jgi:hypothetical protein
LFIFVPHLEKKYACVCLLIFVRENYIVHIYRFIIGLLEAVLELLQF